jgi:lipopolysaccharide transport system ATP-binding protein
MQNNLAIKVTNLSKKYSIGKNENNLSLAERLRYLFRKKNTQENQEEFYALKDINFEIKKGEAVGIIGRNGAGKSTLLKILSRVTEPTEGKVEIYGTVASVLEVGMGFHPELTGRENVYLSGTMMGIPKKQLEAKFDEIVEFAGVEKFIDTPVKHYSSGMYMRLAFSVVANVDADILLFDEVLSVGDLAFQMKCAKKINELNEKKKTILMVSHNMNDIINLCPKIILLNNGEINLHGSKNSIKKYYENVFNTKDNLFLGSENETFHFKNVTLREWEENHAPGDDNLKVIKVWMEKASNNDKHFFFTSDEITFNIEYVKYNNYDFYDIVILLSSNNFQFLACHLFNSNLNQKLIDKGKYILSAKFPPDFLSDIPISLNLSLVNDKGFLHYERDVLRFKCNFTTNKNNYYSQLPNNVCPVLPKMYWECIKLK